jgi:hypothetical protein
MSTSRLYLEFPGGPSGTVTCVYNPLRVPVLELVRIHTGQLKRSAVCRRFGNIASTASVAETKALKNAGAVPTRSPNVRLVGITQLVGVVATPMEAEAATATELEDAAAYWAEQPPTVTAADGPTAPPMPVRRNRRGAVDPNISVEEVLVELGHDPRVLLPVQHWALRLARHAVLAHTDARRTYNTLRAAFGLVLSGATGKRSGTANTICRDEHLLALGGLFAKAPRAKGSGSSLGCTDWGEWMRVADENGFVDAPPLLAPPPLPVVGGGENEWE